MSKKEKEQIAIFFMNHNHKMIVGYFDQIEEKNFCKNINKYININN